MLLLLQERVYDAAKVALGIHNFVPDHGYPKVGPWWFIPFIIQFYLASNSELLRNYSMVWHFYIVGNSTENSEICIFDLLNKLL